MSWNIWNIKNVKLFFSLIELVWMELNKALRHGALILSGYEAICGGGRIFRNSSCNFFFKQYMFACSALRHLVYSESSGFGAVRIWHFVAGFRNKLLTIAHILFYECKPRLHSWGAWILHWKLHFALFIVGNHTNGKTCSVHMTASCRKWTLFISNIYFMFFL